MNIGSNPTEQSRVIAISVLAGKIMLQSGGETYRVEDTMKRMAAALGLLPFAQLRCSDRHLLLC